MDSLNFIWMSIWTNGAAFVFILTVIVFIHEFGHYFVARRCGVRVEVFSIGFGPEIFGWNDRAGTRWKICLLPLGGYVKMFGETSMPGAEGEDARELTAEERAVSFQDKSLARRAAIVSAGPLANFVLAIFVWAVLFATVGQRITPPNVGTVQSGSAAEEAGIKPGDVIVGIEDNEIGRFSDLQRIISISPGVPLRVELRRDGRQLTLTVTPKLKEITDVLGNRHEVGLIGISSAGTAFVRHDPATAVLRAVQETYRFATLLLGVLGEIISGTRSSKELGGPIGIFQMSGQMAEFGLPTVFWFIAVLSVNLGLINLFPIPVLDGGHLMFYAIEAVRGKPPSERFMEYGFRVGLGLVLTLFVFVTYQDIKRFQGVVEFFEGIFS
ncbi:MAG: RIP metalloprotease RseP [Proteobacteria bacterium]|nr:RIP metalloprotease RseP [Pseudomonadota bacterium]